MNELAKIIASEINQRGTISFARFMELALYCPVFGYYEKESDTIGRRGDFYTNVSVGKLFGQMLAWQFAEWLEEIFVEKPKLQSEFEPGIKKTKAGSPANGTTQKKNEQPAMIVEAGTHHGHLARDILDWLRAWRPALFDQLQYWIIEP